MEKADRKLRQINEAWNQLQAFYREQESDGEHRRSAREETGLQRRQNGKDQRELPELSPADLDIQSIISVDHVRQAYQALSTGSPLYDPDPGLVQQEEETVLSGQDGAERAQRDTEEHPRRGNSLHRGKLQEEQGETSAGHDSRTPAGQLPVRSSPDGSAQPQQETETEIGRKMKLLFEGYVQERKERALQLRQEREKSQREQDESEEKAGRERNKKLRILMERYRDRFHAWLTNEKERFYSADLERERWSGINRILRRGAQEKEFPYGIPNIRMISITGGTFAMGRDETGSLFRRMLGNAGNHPRHTVTIRDFYISNYPVTEKQWSRAMGVAVPEDVRHLPVLLSWNDVHKFIARLNEITGLSFRLPTEAEWEYAARSGGKDEKWPEEGSGSSILDYASVDRSRVGHHKANGLGLYDMLGNVAEWTGDWYNPDYFANSVELDPVGPERGDRKVIRGSLLYDATGSPMVADAFSRGFLPVTRFNRAGFRLAHSLL
jgi:formylglycine-generating enzyme required for sulfatase activity